MRVISKLYGQRFGRLTAIEPCGYSKSKRILWRCICDCGRETIVQSDKLKSGHTKSCGCLLSEKTIQMNKARKIYANHNKYNRLYRIYYGMRSRCCNPKDVAHYPSYGGRGIKICQEWLESFPLLFASMLNSKLMKGQGFFKSVYFLPALTSVVVAGTIFRLMFGEMDTSLANQIMELLGKSPIKWLKGEWTGYFALLIVACWRWTGVNILYFLAGLQSIPTDIYEAASIDGASKWQQFIKISFPLVKPTTVYVLTISIYAGLSMFLESFMLWKGNNSPQNIGLTIVGYLYRQGIEKRAMGYACAVGLVLLLVVMVINMIQLIATGTFKKEER